MELNSKKQWASFVALPTSGLFQLLSIMKIDGVSVEPPADDPYAMGHVALDIDCDLDVLAQKVRRRVKSDWYMSLVSPARSR